MSFFETITTENPNDFSNLFFKSVLENGRLAHGYVLKGHCYERMYQTALEIAKILNCKQPVSKTQACEQCTSCLWTKKNTHPSVFTISRLTYLVGDNGAPLSSDDLEKQAKKPEQTLIRTEQIGRLIRELSISSGDYRIVIFTDAESLPGPARENASPPPWDWASIESNENNFFRLRPLHRGLFNAESANRFLKTLEEPPARTLFFFLTDSEENLLETIVSRCQTVPFAGSDSSSVSVPEVAVQLFTDWQDSFYAPHLHDIYPALAEFQRVLIDSEGLSAEQALHSLQCYLRQQYIKEDNIPFDRYRSIQTALEQASRLLKSKTNPDQVLQQLFWQLSVKHHTSPPLTTSV